MPARSFRTLALILLAFLAACQSATSSPLPSSEGASPADGSPSAGPSAGTTYPLDLTDDAGRTVTIAAQPQRIVSLAPSNTEIVCALDACDRLMGVTDFDDYPAEVTDVPKVVVNTVVDVEKVVAADPDLILAAGNELTPSAVITQLADLGYPVMALYPESLDDVLADIRLVGEALDAAGEAAAVVADMEYRIEVVRHAVPSVVPVVFYEVGFFDGTIYTAGEDSFLASLIEAAGATPVTGDALTTSISLEDLLAADPQIILLGDAAYDASIAPESVAARPGWEGLTAVQTGNVFVIAEDPVITRPGPRIVDGLEALARAIHPDRFD